MEPALIPPDAGTSGGCCALALILDVLIVCAAVWLGYLLLLPR